MCFFFITFSYAHTVNMYNNCKCIYYVYCRTADLQDKIRSVQDDIQRINTCIEEHESERSTRYRELRKKEQIFKGIHVGKHRV